jgi:pimeloyl-ACP methyl ester carboxylesterase
VRAGGASRRQFLKLAAAAASVGASAVASDAGGARRVAGWRGARAHFVLVHGAWHGAWCWYKITAALEGAGQMVSALDLPGAGIDPTAPALATQQAQVDRVLALLDAVPEPVILVGHSAGGAVVSLVAEARPEKVAKLVYLSAFLLPDGASLVEAAARDTASLLTGGLVLGRGGAIDVDPSVRRDAFYNRSSEEDVVLAATLLRPVGLQALATPVRLGSTFEGVRRFYISCLEDQAISPAAQRSMYTALPCKRVLGLRESDHSPFFSRPPARAAARPAGDRPGVGYCRRLSDRRPRTGDLLAHALAIDDRPAHVALRPPHRDALRLAR